MASGQVEGVWCLMADMPRRDAQKEVTLATLTGSGSLALRLCLCIRPLGALTAEIFAVDEHFVRVQTVKASFNNFVEKRKRKKKGKDDYFSGIMATMHGDVLEIRKRRDRMKRHDKMGWLIGRGRRRVGVCVIGCRVLTVALVRTVGEAKINTHFLKVKPPVFAVGEFRLSVRGHFYCGKQNNSPGMARHNTSPQD